MATARFRFYGPLNDFLPKWQRQKPFDWPVSQQATIKDAIESLGVPHPEVGLMLVNSQPVDFSYRMQANDPCSIYPAFYQIDVSPLAPLTTSLPDPLWFVLDTHLGKLATYLRLLGFDTLYQNTYTDPELAQISAEQNRILLTRDRGLLMRSVIQRGYFVRQTQPTAQIREIMQRYSLDEQLAPFSRCLVCNNKLVPVEKDVVLDQLPPYIKAHQHAFLRCAGCGNVFWEGSHYKRMLDFINTLVKLPQ